MKIEVLSKAPLSLKLVGSINESFCESVDELSGLLNVDIRNAVIDLSEIQAINSIGIAMWIDFLKNLPVSLQIEFLKCAPVFVDYMNLVPTVLSNGNVASVLVPYECSHCGYEWTFELQIDDELPTEFPKLDCGKCQNIQEAVEEAEEYLSFLEN